VEVEDSNIEMTAEDNRLNGKLRPAPHPRRDFKCAKSLKNVNKSPTNDRVRQKLPHRHVSVDELRLLQVIITWIYYYVRVESY